MSKRPGDPGYAAGWCIHYRSPSQGYGKPELKTCEAGVPYDRFIGAHFGQQPCFLNKKTGESLPDALPCSSLRRPEPEEIAAHQRWLDERWAKQAMVMIGIAGWRKEHKGKSVQEVVECPACHGRLHLSINSRNGHVHGRCETERCVSWME
jgi:hypothetical protein